MPSRFTALPLLVLALTGSGLAMGVVGALQTLPDLVLAMIAGAIADRSDRKRMMLLADLGRAVLTALDPALRRARGPTMAVDPAGRGPDEHLSRVLPRGLHRVGARRSSADRRSPARTRTSRRSTRSGSSSGRRSPECWRRHRSRARRSRSTRLVRALRPSGCCFVRRELRAPVDRPRQLPRRGHPRGDRLHRHEPELRSRRSCSGVRPRSCFAPLVTALAVHDHRGPRRARVRARARAPGDLRRRDGDRGRLRQRAADRTRSRSARSLLGGNLVDGGLSRS